MKTMPAVPWAVKAVVPARSVGAQVSPAAPVRRTIGLPPLTALPKQVRTNVPTGGTGTGFMEQVVMRWVPQVHNTIERKMLLGST